MTKKKKSILSDQRFIVLLVIIALSAVFSIMSKEFRQYTTLLSMLDFSYYDLLMSKNYTSQQEQLQGLLLMTVKKRFE